MPQASQLTIRVSWNIRLLIHAVSLWQIEASFGMLINTLPATWAFLPYLLVSNTQGNYFLAKWHMRFQNFQRKEKSNRYGVTYNISHFSSYFPLLLVNKTREKRTRLSSSFLCQKPSPASSLNEPVFYSLSLHLPPSSCSSIQSSLS